MNESAHRAVAARAEHEQVERGAVKRQLFGRLAVGGVRLDALESGHAVAGRIDQLLDGRFVGMGGAVSM